MKLTKVTIPKYEMDTLRFTETGLADIDKVSLLSGENMKALDAIGTQLSETWRKERQFRTLTEMKYSVLNDSRFPTRGLKYQQSRREQFVHFQNLIFLSCDYEEKQGELMDLKDQMNKESSPAKKKILSARIRRCEYQLMTMQREAHHRVREVTSWQTIMDKLNDGSFNPDDYDAVQMEGYPQRWQVEMDSKKRHPQAEGLFISNCEGMLSAIENEL